MNEFELGVFPSFKEGALRHTKKMSRYLKQRAAGRFNRCCNSGLTCPAAPIT